MKTTLKSNLCLRRHDRFPAFSQRRHQADGLLQESGSRVLSSLAALAWDQTATQSSFFFSDEMKRIGINIGQAEDEKARLRMKKGQAKDEKPR